MTRFDIDCRHYTDNMFVVYGAKFLEICRHLFKTIIDYCITFYFPVTVHRIETEK